MAAFLYSKDPLIKSMLWTSFSEDGDVPYLPSVARSGLTLEVGPVAHSTTKAKSLQRTKEIVLLGMVYLQGNVGAVSSCIFRVLHLFLSYSMLVLRHYCIHTQTLSIVHIKHCLPYLHYILYPSYVSQSSNIVKYTYSLLKLHSSLSTFQSFPILNLTIPILVLDYLECRNMQNASSSHIHVDLPIHEKVKEIPYPDQHFIHPDIDGIQELHTPLKADEKVFLSLDGQTSLSLAQLEGIPSGKSLFPVFVNEAAYYEKKIALCLATRFVSTVQTVACSSGSKL